MKVAIIAPPYPLEEAPAPPLGITYVAAAFEAAGADVKIFDYIVTGYSPEKLQAQLDAFRPDVVGSTSVTLNFSVAAGIMQAVKRHAPRVITVMGGPHVSFTAESTLTTYPEIDLLVLGEGEATIAELMHNGMDPASWPDTQGIAFRRNGEVTTTPPRPFIADLDSLPLPARHLLPLSRYQALGYPISIITSRGCPYTCIFCQGRRMVGQKVRQRQAKLVVDEIEHILSYGIDRINVADDLFVSNKEKVSEVCTEIRKRGLVFAWSAFARVNTVDLETLLWMREAGCDSISYGVESGNPEMLRRIRKGITLDQVRKAVDMCSEAGLICHTSFMAGLPGETTETLADTKRFASSLGSLYGYHILAPFPGTTVREEVDRYDLTILTDDWSKYDANQAVACTSRLSAEDINRFVAAFDGEIEESWEKQVRGYHAGTNSYEENLRVEGYFRTQIIFRILSGDLMERHGSFPGDTGAAEAAHGLCGRLAEVTGTDLGQIRRVIDSFIEKGYIHWTASNGRGAWSWTHNNRG